MSLKQLHFCSSLQTPQLGFDFYETTTRHEALTMLRVFGMVRHPGSVGMRTDGESWSKDVREDYNRLVKQLDT